MTTSSALPPASRVTLRLSPVEALAARGGIGVAVAAEGLTVAVLDDVNRIAVATLALPATLQIGYRTAAGEAPDPPVVWTQQIAAGESGAEIVQPWRSEPPTELPDHRLVWQALGDRAEYVDQLEQALRHVTVVSPIWWYVGADGTISDTTDPRYVDDVHRLGVEIWPAVAGLDADANHALLADGERRSAAIRRISDRARDIGADGVNVDIEGFRDEDGAAFTTFMRELTRAVHEWGGIVSFDLIPRSDRWDIGPPELAFWSTAPQRGELAAVADYTVLMAYDEHNRYRPAGPVASPPWVDDVLTYALRFVDPHRLILGVPFYGRIWDPVDLSAPRAVGVGALARTASSGIGTFDPGFGLDRVDLPDGRYLWLEDPEVIASRLDLVDELGLAGWAAWRLGFDSAALWEAIAAR